MAEYDTKIQQVVADIELEEQAPYIISLSSGVRLKLKKISPLRILAIVNKFKYPEVPEFWDEKRERPIRNPDSPAYLAMKETVDTDRMFAVYDAIAAIGTEIDYIPDGFSKPEDDDWLEEQEVIGVPVNKDSKLARYLAWVKYKAIASQTDMQLIGNEFGLALGISEARIAGQVEANFPDRA
jgi:hypothetical protein